MVWNNIKTALRNLKNHFGFSLINILGLAIGIACMFLVYLYVNYEFSYDKCFEDYDRICRIRTDDYTFGDEVAHFAHSREVLTPILKDNYPQIESICCFKRPYSEVLEYNGKTIYSDRNMVVDPSFFTLFPAKFITGSSSGFDRPNTCVITQKVADTYFNGENPIGKLLTKNRLTDEEIKISENESYIKEEAVDYEVIGIIENWPSNTHINFDFIFSSNYNYNSSWNKLAYIYVKLKPGVEIAAFDEGIRNIFRKEMGEHYNGETDMLFFAQPLTDIHFNTTLSEDISVPGNSKRVYLFLAVGLLILVIACFNYMNLTTSRYANRVKEIGVRKTAGAGKINLIIQFLFESFLFTVLAFLIGLLLAKLMLPFLNDFLQLNLSIDFTNSKIITGTVVLIFTTSLFAGSYPAFFLSSLKPEKVIRGIVHVGSASHTIRRVLVISQFAVSIVLVVAVIAIYQQLSFMKSYSLGFDKNHKLVIHFPEDAVDESSYQSVKNQFQQISQVRFCSFTDVVPGRKTIGGVLFFPGEAFKKSFPATEYYVDKDFCSLFDLGFAAGNNFNNTTGTDFILNETAVKVLGWNSPEEAIGKNIFNNRSQVVGVIKDYHFKGLHEKIEAQVLSSIDWDFNYLILDVNAKGYAQAIKSAQKIYKKMCPDAPFDYFFLDDDFNKQYRAEEQMGFLFLILSGLGILITCLGLFGLAIFMAQKRIKEIGVRKVNGAKIAEILILLNSSFIKWVAVAFIIACPVAYYAMNKWLENFAYKISLSWWIFALAGVLALGIALLTVSWQSWRAATRNPVEALRYE